MAGVHAEQTQRLGRRPPLLLLFLAGLYAALIPLLARLETSTGVTILLAVSAAISLSLWLIGELRARPFRLPMMWALDALRGLPAPILWLPLPLSFSWIAAEIARGDPGRADYSLAFVLWLTSMAVVVAIFVVPLVIEHPRPLWTKLRAALSTELLVVAFLTTLALVVRLVALDSEPGPFWSDEADVALRAIEVQASEKVNLFHLGGGTVQPTLYYAIVAWSFDLFGTGVLAARLPTALLGAATVPLLYLFLREAFDRRVALVGAAFLVVFHYHIHYSRLAFNNVGDAFVAVLVLYWAFRALRTQALLDFAFAGLAAGLVLYFFPGARVVLMVLPVLGTYVAVRTRGVWIRQNLWGLSAFVLAFFVAALPALLYFDDNPDNFRSRFELLNIYDSGWLDAEKAATGHSELHVLWDQVQQAIGLLLFYPDLIDHYGAGVPLLDSASRVLFIIGGLYALVHVFQPRFVALFALMAVTVFFGGAIIEPPISSARLLAVVPVTAAFVALGLVRPVELIAQYLPVAQRPLLGLAAIAVGVIAFLNLHFYFASYLPSDSFGDGRNSDAAAVAEFLGNYDSSYAVYMFDGPEFNLHHSTLAFLSRDKALIDASNGLPDSELPVSDRPNVVFLFGGDRNAELGTVLTQCPNGSGDLVQSYTGRTLLRAYSITGAQSCLDRLTSEAADLSSPG